MDVAIARMTHDNIRTGKSGLLLVSDNYEAFAARVLAARSAVRTLDLMYYLWHDDHTGRLLLHEVFQAAQRGVRVRMLLDDVNPRKNDSAYLALGSHPNIELKLFNPSGIRAASRAVWKFSCDFLH
jgi:putative cardiolipin synthase